MTRFADDRCVGSGRFVAAVIVSAALFVGAPSAAFAQEALAPVQGADGQSEAAQLRKRVEQLEAQIVDMQVVIGTLESLARSGGARPAAGASAGFGGGGQANSGRLDVMEMQIRALTTQIEQLNRGGAPAGVGVPGDRSDLSAPGVGNAAGWSSVPPTAEADPYVGTFGSTTVNSDRLENFPDPAGGPVASGREDAPLGWGGMTRPRVAALEEPTVDPKFLYERAYGALLQQDYPTAQSEFTDFLKRFPQDKLAADALYWLGEVHYVQRNYQDAVEAFDLVTMSYRGSRKAPDAQYKHGVALARLGKTRDACSVLKALPRKFPKAAKHLKSKAQAERQRVGCP